MLKYDVHTGERDIEILESEVRGLRLTSNPFPGLRPFGIEECHLFFGREGQVDDVLMKLAHHRFVAVMGFSGSGKSSLMYCGLIPVLYGGFMTDVGPNWKVLVTRPGIGPLDNLAESILQANPEYAEMPEEDRIIQHTVTSSILRSGVKGLVDLAKNLREDSGENLLIVVDQFEELFRYHRDEDDSSGTNESALFINMLLEAIKQTEVPIYLALTMRSEFIGECSKFPGLTQMINTSNYLVPLMTRDQKRRAIEGPVAVGGGKIAPRLVKQLLSDVREETDQLPVMQHVLMRAWGYWEDHKEKDEPLDIRHYNAVGRVAEALSLHANEAFDELDDRQKVICEALFKTITEKSSDNIGIRRPTKLRDIALIAGADEEEVKGVVEHFREPSRSLLMPAANVPLDSDSVIELSHESLIRIWIRLKTWVEEEYASAQMYRRISEAAAMYQIGRTGLWRPPDLQLALNWQKKQQPTRVWAQRYDPAFERAVVFLDTSRITYEAEQKNQEMMQKRLLRRARAVALSLGIAAVILVIFFIFAVFQKLAADQQRDEAVALREVAERASIVAQQQRDLASTQFREAQKNLIRSRIASQKALVNLLWARRQQGIAQTQTQLALQREREATLAKEQATIARDEAVAAREIAESRRLDIERLLHLSAAQSMSVKSVNVADGNLQGLLAHQAYMFNTQYVGNPFDPYIYDGLYEAVKSFEGNNLNKFYGHRDAVRSVAFASTGLTFFSAGSDGTVRKWDYDDPANNQVLYSTRTHPNRVISVSDDGRWMAVGSDSTSIQLYDLRADNPSPRFIAGHKSFVSDMAFTSDNQGLYTLSYDRTLRHSNLQTSRLVKHLESSLKTMVLSPDDAFIIGGSREGKLVRIDLQSLEESVLFEDPGNPIHSVDISPDGKTVVFGDERGLAHVWDLSSGQEVNTLRGNTARIHVVRFSRNGKMLATGSYDGSAQLYTMDNLNELPIVLRHPESYVWDISFSEDDQFLVTATQNNILKLWPTRADYFAEEMCERISRNMDKSEWEKYVPTGIDYRVTCSSYESGEGGK